jgi:hypothetical protein
MDLFVDAIDTINRFVLGLLFYFLTFSVILVIPNFVMYRIFHADPAKEETLFVAISLLVTIPLGIYINSRFINGGKSKFIRKFLIILQAILFCIGVGFAAYIFFLFVLDLMRTF